MNSRYLHGGDSTPQYYCKICQQAHSRHSGIGKNHIEFENKNKQR